MLLKVFMDPFISQLLFFSLVGLIAGVASGLLGISGGIITIPFFLVFFQYLGIPNEILMHTAIGTSLAAMTITTISSVYFHHRKRGIIWAINFFMLPGVLIGSFIGAYIADLLPSKVLQILFGIFECFMGTYFLFSATKEKAIKTRKNLSFPTLATIGFGISSISALFGIGGGPFTVPVLHLFLHLSLKQAIGTSAANGLFVTASAAIFYLILGWNKTSYPDMWGFIYFPAFIITSIVSLFFAPVGVKLAHVLPAKKLKRVFGIAIFILGFFVLFFFKRQ